MVGLAEIQESVQQISEAIASVLNVDVIVSDNEFRKIGDTKKHFDLEVKQIKDTYVLGMVLRSGKTLVISGKDECEACIVCSERDKCKLQAMICVPIKRENQSIGAIGLIAITKEARTDLLKNQTNLIEYVERMLDLIISKLMEKEATEKLTVAKNQLILIMDSIEEGIAAVDEHGRIVYLDSILEDILNAPRESLIDRTIQEVFPGPYVALLVKDGTPFNHIEKKDMADCGPGRGRFQPRRRMPPERVLVDHKATCLGRRPPAHRRCSFRARPWGAVELGIDAQVFFDGEVRIAGEGLGNDADSAGEPCQAVWTRRGLSTRARPAVTGMRVVIIRMRVLLPAPLGPSKPKISPSATEKLTSLTASK